jgi:hypothetical protein
MDFGRSFGYVTRDPRWISKLVIAAAINSVPILSFALTGYALEIVRRVYTGAPQELPEWDELGDMFVRGLVVSLGLFIWTLPLTALFIAGVVAGFALDDSGALGVISLCVLSPLLLLIGAFFLPVVFTRYAIAREFGAMFDIGAIVAEVRNAVGALALAAILAAAALFAATLAGLVLCLIGTIVTVPFAYLVVAHMYGQVYREARPPAIAQQSTAF